MDFWGHIKTYKIDSIFVKNFIASLFVMFIPIVLINVLVFNFYNAKMLNDYEQSAIRDLDVINQNMDRISNWVDTNCNYMINDNYIALFLYDIYDSTTKQGMDLSKNVKMQLDKIMLAEPCITSVYIYSSKSNYVLSTTGLGKIDVFYDQTIKDNISDYDNKLIYIYYAPSGRKMIRIQYPISIYGDDCGMVFVNIDYEDLVISLERNLKKLDYVSIEYDNEKIVELGEKKEVGNEIIKIERSNNNFNYYAVYDNAFDNTLVVVITGIISVIFAVISAIFLTYKTCVPISKIVDIISGINLYKKDNNKFVGEIKYILDSFDNKVHYGKEIEKSLQEKVTEMRKMQIETLNLQIRPHFLFNTLQLVSMCAMDLTDSENDAVIAVEMLSKILKYSLNTKTYLDTVKNEIEFTRAYVNIQKLRYNERIAVDFDINEQILNKKTSKIIIQPLIENSFTHGILPYKKNGHIKVSVYSNNNILIIEVIDDGIGITDKRRKEIMNVLKNRNEIIDNHIGIFNIDRKIKLIFGERYGIEIDKSYTDGTKIIVRQPLID